MLRALSLAIGLAVLWLLLSGYWHEPLLLGLGLASVLLSVVVAGRMGGLDDEGHPVHLLGRGLAYWPWLIKEIGLANWDVAKAILGWQGPIEPTVFAVRASQASDLGRVIYANSITLTPGTVTLELAGGRLLVHALTRGAVEGLQGGEMDRRVRRLAG